MKHIYLSILALFIFSIANSQCDAPQLIDWVSIGDNEFEVTFESEIDAPYELEIRADYGASDFIIETQILTGNSAIGTNSVNVIVDDGVSNISRIYFTALLRIECEPGVFSDSTAFYMSAHSLTGGSGFACDSLYYLFEPLPDLNGVPFEAFFEVPDEGELIESLSLFIEL